MQQTSRGATRQSEHVAIPFSETRRCPFVPLVKQMALRRVLSLSAACEWCGAASRPPLPTSHELLHSAKGGAVETGCSDLYGVIY